MNSCVCIARFPKAAQRWTLPRSLFTAKPDLVSGSVSTGYIHSITRIYTSIYIYIIYIYNSKQNRKPPPLPFHWKFPNRFFSSLNKLFASIFETTVYIYIPGHLRRRSEAFSAEKQTFAERTSSRIGFAGDFRPRRKV